MGLVGKTNAEKIWNYLKAAGLSDCGAAGLMGNLKAESGLNPMNLQNSYERKLGYSDADYTVAVDNGIYDGFVNDKAGYGLAQWTYWSRKQALLAHVRSRNASIGDLEAQLSFLMKELAGYSGMMDTLKTAKTVKQASDKVLLDFERPADQSETAKARRAGFGQEYYKQFAKKEIAIMTEKEQRAKVVAIAEKYLGCKESDGSHRKIIDRYNDHKPLARGYPVKYTDEWCATFVSAVFIEAGLTSIAPTECGCGKMIDLYKKLGSWVENDAYVPKPGDVIMYDWEDSGVGDNLGAPNHVGIVASVSGNSVKIIEGNKGEAVAQRQVHQRVLCAQICRRLERGEAQSTGAEHRQFKAGRQHQGWGHRRLHRKNALLQQQCCERCAMSPRQGKGDEHLPEGEAPVPSDRREGRRLQCLWMGKRRRHRTLNRIWQLHLYRCRRRLPLEDRSEAARKWSPVQGDCGSQWAEAQQRYRTRTGTEDPAAVSTA